MKLHAVNFDAIREGARALLASYPDEPAGPTSIPARVHAILWEDDWWRGVTMMREACTRAFQAESEEVLRRAGHGDPRGLVAMQRRQRATCRAVLGEAKPGDAELDLHEDEVDVLRSYWAQVSENGCLECHGPAIGGDIEGEHDELEEA